MRKGRRQHPPEFKARVVLDALKERETVAELAGKHEIHSSLVHLWKKHLLDRLPEVMGDARQRREQDHEAELKELYERIGRLQVENAWLQKKLGM